MASIALAEQILNLLEKNSRLTNEEISVMLDVDLEIIESEVSRLEKEKVICGYRTLIDWDKVIDNDVTALVEVRVNPQGGDGYQKLAEKIGSYPQVETLYLMSGAYDFLVMVKGKNIKEISMFVNSKLASIHEVQTTTTHFILTKYKELDANFGMRRTNNRMVVTP